AVAHPDDLARFRVDAEQVAAGAVRVHTPVVECRCRAWTVAVVELLVGHVVGIGPDRLTGLRIEAQDAFLLPRLRLLVEGVAPGSDDGCARVAAADRLAPARLELRG